MAGREYDDDEPIVSSFHQSAASHIKDLLFAVLFYMVHGNDSNAVVEYLTMIIEGMQLAAFFIRSTTEPIYILPNFSMDIKYNEMTINQFAVFFGASTAAIWLMIINLGYVAWGVERKRHNSVWPIRTLRLFSSVLSTVLYITVLEILVFAVACRGNITQPTPTDLLADISCLSSARMPITIIAGVTLVFFVPMCCGLTAVYFDINPILKAPMNKVHGRVDLLQCMLRTALIFVWGSTSDGSYILRYGATFAAPTAIVIATWTYFPHYALRLNQMRAALHGGAAIAGAIAFVWAFIYHKTGIVGSNAVIITMTVAYLVSAVLTYIATVRQMDRLVNGGLGETEFIFDSWMHVEIAARMVTGKMDSRHKWIDQSKIEYIHKIFKHGIAEFPHEPFVRLCYASYMIQLKSPPEEPTRQLKRVFELNPAIDIQFQGGVATTLLPARGKSLFVTLSSVSEKAYFNDQVHLKREVDFLGSGVHLDVAGFAEFHKLEEEAKLNHYKALRLYQEIWTLLFYEPHRISELSEFAWVLYEAIETAGSAYATLIRIRALRGQRNKRDLLKDTAKAELLSNRADRIESRRESVRSKGSLDIHDAFVAAPQQEPIEIPDPEIKDVDKAWKNRGRRQSLRDPEIESVSLFAAMATKRGSLPRGSLVAPGISSASIGDNKSLRASVTHRDSMETPDPQIGETFERHRGRRQSIKDPDIELVSLFAAVDSKRNSLSRRSSVTSESSGHSSSIRTGSTTAIPRDSVETRDLRRKGTAVSSRFSALQRRSLALSSSSSSLDAIKPAENQRGSIEIPDPQRTRIAGPSRYSSLPGRSLTQSISSLGTNAIKSVRTSASQRDPMDIPDSRKGSIAVASRLSRRNLAPSISSISENAIKPARQKDPIELPDPQRNETSGENQNSSQRKSLKDEIESVSLVAVVASRLPRRNMTQSLSSGNIYAVRRNPMETADPWREGLGAELTENRSQSQNLKDPVFSAVAYKHGSSRRSLARLPIAENQEMDRGGPGWRMPTIQSVVYNAEEEREPVQKVQMQNLPRNSGLPITEEKDPLAAMRFIDTESSIATSNAGLKRTEATRKLRISLLRANTRYMKFLISCCLIVRLVCIGCSIANWVVSNNLLSSTSDGLDFLYWLHVREYSTAFELLRIRQLQDAHEDGDKTKFLDLQVSLRNQMLVYSDAINKIFSNRPMDDGGLSNDYYTVPQIPVNVSYFPERLYSTSVNYSLQQLTEAFVMCGINIANLEFETFSNITMNNDFRFIVDNAPYVQVEAFDYSMNILYFNDQTNIANSASVEMYGLSSLQIFVSLFMVIMLDQSAQRFKRREGAVLEVLRGIPRNMLSEQIAQYEEKSLNELFGSELVSSSELLQRKETFITRFDLRWHYCHFVLVNFFSPFAIPLIWRFKDVYSLGQYFAILDQFGDMRTFAVRAYADIHEIQPALDLQTWLSREYLYEWADHDIQYVAMTYGHVLYGDNTRYPPSVSYDQYSPALQQMLQTPCLPLNQSLCNERIYEPSIGPPNNTVTLGIFMLTEYMLDILLKTDAALSLGSFIPEASDLSFIKTVLEPDYVDGYHRCELEVLAEARQFLSSAKLRNAIITIVELGVILTGLMVSLTTMITKLQRQHTCNVNLILRLPNEILRYPVVAAVLQSLIQGKTPRVLSSPHAPGVEDPDPGKVSLTESQTRGESLSQHRPTTVHFNERM
ncbi:hypothetical protein BDK51DRAFT_31742 [Blyttiomyces helicus]|uniref:Uncharacterized protein n=1 Tax=Blyttiomyces helicus TaxID=388810 RepID=A0A4P9WQ18_9FUNG|nr:hypothetical protein BDK51DRAFT_31742 [Blyttiomyces helicus]|eukprot:RKO94662.1 hypothetical protein BDK51DRAFT_31742 [Blyttiomyces helicus]